MSNISPFAVKDAGGIATKVEIIIDAYSQLRISGITVQPTPEDLEVALMRLENMMAEWQTRVCVGYNFEDNPDPNTEINVKRAFWHCLATNLAVRLIPDFNKAVPQVLMMQASSSYSAMSGSIALDRLNQEGQRIDQLSPVFWGVRLGQDRSRSLSLAQNQIRSGRLYKRSK